MGQSFQNLLLSLEFFFLVFVCHQTESTGITTIAVPPHHVIPRFKIPHGNISNYRNPNWELLYFLKHGTFPMKQPNNFYETSFTNRLQQIKGILEKKPDVLRESDPEIFYSRSISAPGKSQRALSTGKSGIGSSKGTKGTRTKFSSQGIHFWQPEGKFSKLKGFSDGSLRLQEEESTSRIDTEEMIEDWEALNAESPSSLSSRLFNRSPKLEMVPLILPLNDGEYEENNQEKGENQSPNEKRGLIYLRMPSKQDPVGIPVQLSLGDGGTVAFSEEPRKPLALISQQLSGQDLQWQKPHSKSLHRSNVISSRSVGSPDFSAVDINANGIGDSPIDEAKNEGKNGKFQTQGW